MLFRSDSNTFFYPGTSDIAQSVYVGGGTDIEFTNNSFFNSSIYCTSTPSKVVVQSNEFTYGSGVTTYRDPLVFDGIGAAQLLVDDNIFNMANNSATAAIYWAGNLSTGIIGSLSNNQVWSSGASIEIIEPGRTSYDQPFYVSKPNIKLDPSTNVKITSTLKTTDQSRSEEHTSELQSH